jgi:group I intron endonuclease
MPLAGFFDMVGIYKITSPTGAVYIGQSIDILRRFANYRLLRCKTQVRLYNSLVKHGAEKHKFDIICTCDKEDLNEFEIYYIDLFQSFNTERGMNLCSGGLANREVSDETKKKMSESMRGNKNPFYGKKHSSETLKKMKQKFISESTREKIRASKKNLSLESRLNISEGQKKRAPLSILSRIKMSRSQRGRKHSEETKRKISEGNSKRIGQYSLNGEKVGEYNSITDASLLTGIKRTSISGCVNGRAKKTKGFLWKKLNETK